MCSVAEREGEGADPGSGLRARQGMARRTRARKQQNRWSSRDGGCFEMETWELSDFRDASVAGAGPLIGLADGSARG